MGSTRPYSVVPTTPTTATVSSSTSSAIASGSARYSVSGAVRSSTWRMSAALRKLKWAFVGATTFGRFVVAWLRAMRTAWMLASVPPEVM